MIHSHHCVTISEVPRFLSQFLRYGCTGGVAAVVDLSMFILLLKINLPIAVAATASFLMAAVVNYGLTSRYVFDEDPEVFQFVRFLGAALIGLSVNVAVTVVATRELSLLPTSAKLLGIAIAFSLNFLMNQMFVFDPRRKR